jgi:hypothetical protein
LPVSTLAGERLFNVGGNHAAVEFQQLQMQVIELASRMHAIQQRLAELTIPRR